MTLRLDMEMEFNHMIRGELLHSFATGRVKEDQQRVIEKAMDKQDDMIYRLQKKVEFKAKERDYNREKYEYLREILRKRQEEELDGEAE